MKIILHDNHLSERGTTRSIINLARALRKYHNIDPIISFRSFENLVHYEPLVMSINKEFQTFKYSRVEDLQGFTKKNKIDVLYAQKAGRFDGVFTPYSINYIHSVFQSSDHHGHVYSYVSRWLLKKMGEISRHEIFLERLRNKINSEVKFKREIHLNSFSRKEFREQAKLARSMHKGFRPSYLPLIVPTFVGQEGLRTKLQIPSDSIVLWILAGRNSFDIAFVREWLPKFLDAHDDYFLVAPNIDPWFTHSRVRWLPTLASDEERSIFLTEVDAVIHARKLGESFGLAITEALSAGKPVFACSMGIDRNHIELLSDSNLIYTSAKELEALCLKLQHPHSLPNQGYLKLKVREYLPEVVSDLFVHQISLKSL